MSVISVRCALPTVPHPKGDYLLVFVLVVICVRIVVVIFIHSMPSQHLINRYQAAGAQVVTIDPGKDVVMARAKRERPWRIQQAAKEWYAQRPHSYAPAANTQHPASKQAGTRQW